MTSDAPRAAPSYEGRRLPRPAADLEDQGLGFDVATLMSRRRLLGAVGLGALAVGAAACGASSSGTGSSGSATTSAAGSATLTEIPDETAGPYPGDGSNGANVLTESGVVRSDIRTSFGTSTTTAPGIPMTIELDVVDMANGGKPFAGVAVYVWHCNRAGEYSLYSQGVTGENYLRGVQVADSAGTVRFTSIFPACYSGRWPHIHFEVYPDQASITDASKAIATSQLALPEATCTAAYATAGYEKSVTNLAGVTLASDNVFGDDSGATQLGTVTGDPAGGYAVSLRVGVDTTTTPAAGGGAPGGPPPGGGGPGGPPPGN